MSESFAPGRTKWKCLRMRACWPKPALPWEMWKRATLNESLPCVKQIESGDYTVQVNELARKLLAKLYPK